MKNTISLKTRIILVSVATTLIVVIILLSLGMVSNTKMKERIADAALTGNRIIWEKLNQDERDRIAGYVDSFNNEFDLRSALKRNDNLEITKYADRYVNLTKNPDSYDTLQIYTPEKVQVYSSVEGSQLQDIDTLLESVLDSRQTRSGILTTRNGQIFNVVAFLSQSRRKILGVGVYAKQLDHVLQLSTKLTNITSKFRYDA